MYSCAKCGKPVTVKDGAIKRDCACTEAVIASVRVDLKGTGGLK